MMPSRRQFLGALSIPAVTGVAVAYLDPATLRRALAAMGERAQDSRSPEPITRDEDFWFPISRAFTVIAVWSI